ncbi:hypothetical protein R5R35_004922 [Gryllus longicercus]|uniref:Uncharacterized protein n=1 Tax=Gryllus longicercus TaxID=2509291 RepID=A0AAN9V947_9ORTH
MYFRRRYPSTSSLIIITGALLLLTFMLKHLYDNNQKCNRMNNYQQLMQELSDHMQSVELAANKSAANLNQLNKVLIQQHQQLAQKLEITGDDKKSGNIHKSK